MTAQLLSRRTLGMLAGTLAASCAGGQTGQSAGAECSTSVDADEDWNGRTLQALAQALGGSHAANLLWLDPNGAPLALDDRISITLTYAGDAGREACGGSLAVPVEVTLGSEASGIAETAPASLTFTTAASPLTAKLDYASARLTLSVTLTALAEQVAPTGELEARSADLPGPAARIEGP